MGCAFPHADENSTVSDRLHVTPLNRRVGVVFVFVTPPDLEFGVFEHRVKPVHRPHDERFRLSRRPEHRVHGNAIKHPA